MQVRRYADWAATWAAVCWSAAVLAHHSISMVEIGKPMWVTGTVVEYVVRHPHVMFTLDVKGADGRPQKMQVEGPNLARLARIGADEHFMKAGDVLSVCGFHLKEPYYKADFIHGQVLVLPDGKMRLWGPYGRLENCIRPGDSHEKWVTFLKQDPAALPSWCDSRLYVKVPSVAPAGFVAAVNQLLGNPCK
jgi:hypothetical protein